VARIRRRQVLQGAAAAGAAGAVWATPGLVRAATEAVASTGSAPPDARTAGGTTTTQEFLKVAGPSGPVQPQTLTQTGLGRPQGLFVTPTAVFLADFDQRASFPINGGRLLRYDKATKAVSVVFGGGGGNLIFPTDVAVDGAGNVWFPDHGSCSFGVPGALKRLNGTSGPATVVDAAHQTPNYVALAVDGSTILVSDTGCISGPNAPVRPNDADHRRVKRYATTAPFAKAVVAGNGVDTGFPCSSTAWQAATSSPLRVPFGLAVLGSGTSGSVFVSDEYAHLVYEVDLATGQLRRCAGTCSSAATPTGDGGLATSANVPLPQGLAVDDLGNLYVLQINGRVRRIARNDGTISTIANFAVDMGSNAGIAFDHGDGSLYVTRPKTGVLYRLPAA
jgi:sugar lactone lactonase YvrE